jgi:hypothetical protein
MNAQQAAAKMIHAVRALPADLRDRVAAMLRDSGNDYEPWSGHTAYWLGQSVIDEKAAERLPTSLHLGMLVGDAEQWGEALSDTQEPWSTIKAALCSYAEDWRRERPGWRTAADRRAEKARRRAAQPEGEVARLVYDLEDEDYS